ncbi:MAG: metal-dependent hydrolase, partial [Pseudomonadales bacterium]|nr:metal-dependent hydrolase [Pseudomonadales bacterium]
NHKRMNELVKAKLPDWCAHELSKAEQALNDDYQKFTKNKSLKWNLAYAEGFEAMTFAMAQNSFENPNDNTEQRWKDLYEWHLAEEIEHRNVAYDAYDKIYGGYFYRLFVGLWAQYHFLGFVARFAKIIARGLKEQGHETILTDQKGGGMSLPRQYWRTLSPWYNPSKIVISGEVQDMLTKWDMAVN